MQFWVREEKDREGLIRQDSCDLALGQLGELDAIATCFWWREGSLGEFLGTLALAASHLQHPLWVVARTAGHWSSPSALDSTISSSVEVTSLSGFG